MTEHPYLIYAKALLMLKNDLKAEDEITEGNIIHEIKYCLKHYSLIPRTIISGKKDIRYEFSDKDGCFIASNYLDKKIKVTIQR